MGTKTEYMRDLYMKRKCPFYSNMKRPFSLTFSFPNSKSQLNCKHK